MLDLDYGFDLAGNIMTIADAGPGLRGRNYGYDELHRLTQADELLADGVTVARGSGFDYDSVGNRTVRDVVSPTLTGTETYSYDAFSNQLLSTLATSGGLPVQTRTLGHGASGNRDIDAAAGVSNLAFAMGYDSTDRLVAVADGGVAVADYLHNAMGQRVAKTVGAAVTHYVYDLGGRLIAEYDAVAAGWTEYVALEGMSLAFIATGNIYWIHEDHLGTPQMLTDGTRAVAWSALYAPFGAVEETGALAFNQRFPGQYHDRETGYYYNYFRTYDPASGRYLESDPIGLRGGWNTYGYVSGNPVTRVDPRGLEGNACGGYWIKIREEFLTTFGGHDYDWDEFGWPRIGDCKCVWACKWCAYTPREATTFGQARHPYFDLDKPWFDGEPGPCNCEPPGRSLLKPCPRLSCLGRPEEFA